MFVKVQVGRPARRGSPPDRWSPRGVALGLLCLASAAWWGGPARVAAQDKSAPILTVDAGGHTASPRGLAFTTDGRELISVSDDKTIRFWDVETGEPVRTLRPPIGPGREGMLYTVAVSPDGRYLAATGLGWADENYSAIYIISLAAGKIERVLKGHNDGAHCLAFSRDSTLLASGSFDFTARVWSVRTGECLKVLEGHEDSVFGVAFSPDGSKLVTGSFDKSARLWSVSNGATLAILRGHTDKVRCVDWSPDGRTIITGGYDLAVRLWEPSGAFRKRIDGLPSYITSARFLANSREVLLTWGEYNFVHGAGVYDTGTGRQLSHFEHANTVLNGAASPDGRVMASSDAANNEVFLWRAATGERLHTLGASGRIVWGCGWSPDGESIAWGNSNVGSGLEFNQPIERTFNLTTMRFGPAPRDDYRRAVLSRGSLSLAQTDRVEMSFKQGERTLATWKAPLPQDRVVAGTLLPNDEAVVATLYSLYLVNARTGEELREFRGHTGTIWGVANAPGDKYFMSCSSDMTVRVWRSDRAEPLLSMFFASEDWIAWTPEGYYDCSPGGERLMGWAMNQGRDALATFYPANQFRASLYRPAVIQNLLKAGSVERALEMANQTSSRVDVSEVLPPSVAIVSPKEPKIRVTEAALEVRALARVTGKFPITEMQLLVDGRPYQGEAGKKNITRSRVDEKSASESWTVELSPGIHEIKVKAATSKSYGLSEPVQVIYAPDEVELPTLYVLAMGVSDYQDEKLNLDYAAKDARALAAAFTENGQQLFRQVKTKVLTDEQATRRGVLQALKDFRTNVTQRDIGVIFFSGHGVKDVDGVFYLAPHDIEADDISVSAVAEEEVKRYCQAIPCRLIVMLDTCHAGSLDVGGLAKSKQIGGLADNLVRDLVNDDLGVIVMASSMGSQTSQERAEWGHGAFTKALIEGLKGDADANNDSTVYFHELDAFVTERVKTLTNNKQNATTTKPGSVRSFPLARP